jgi:energy-coupling factor transporter transmembrane protein EcfT
MTRSPARDGGTHPAGWRPDEDEDRRVLLSDRLAGHFEARSATRVRRDVHLLRYVPGDSQLHRLWAGTKLVGVAALSIALFIWPTWVAEGLVAVLLLTILLAVRIPAGAVPRPPAWVWVLLAIGAGIAFASGGSPFLHVGGVRLAMGGLETWSRFVVLAIEFLTTAALVGWTTPLAELAPALARLAGPLRKLRVPVDELAVALALVIRCLPLVVEELRTLRDARRARRPAGVRKARELVDDTIELAVAALLSALRRAGELADAIEARGGATTVRHDVEGPGRRDAVALAVLAVALVAVGILA